MEPAGEQPVLQTIRAIQAGSLAPKQLSQADRRACVDHLTGEGYTAAEIAEILQTTERTIYRDRKALLAAHALEHDPAFAGQMAGRLLQEAERSIVKIRRVTRDRATPAAVKIDGERKCFRIAVETVEVLQRLGYLPNTATELRADITHRLGMPDAETLRHELNRLQEIGANCNLSLDDQEVGMIDRLLEGAELSNETPAD